MADTFNVDWATIPPGATIPPELEEAAGGFIPTFPIPIPVDFNESYYSVNVTLRQDGSCAGGYICNKTHQASCDEIQQVAITEFRYGDIHGGAYCPEGSAFYLNCPIGYYCPKPVSIHVYMHSSELIKSNLLYSHILFTPNTSFRIL